MKVQLVRLPDGLAANSACDEKALAKLKPGDVVMADLKKSRNPEFHKLVFNMLTESFENQEKFSDFTQYRHYLMIAAGLCDPIVKSKGEVWYVVKSLAWDQMDETEFEQAFQKLLTAAVERMGQDWLLERY